MEVTLPGIFMLVSALALVNALFEIVVMVLPAVKVTVVTAVDP